MLIMGGGALALMRFCMAIRPPKVVLVSAQAAISMAALGAEALAHSASRMASASLGDDARSGAVIAGQRGGGGRVDLRERSGSVTGEAESLTEGAPIRSAEDVGIFNEHDG